MPVARILHDRRRLFPEGREMADMPTPFFGIGAMRSGTTWLANLLESYSDCAMMPHKELHFFDVRYGKYPGAQYYRDLFQTLASQGAKTARRSTAVLDEMYPRQDGERECPGDPELDESPHHLGLVPWTDEIRREFFARAEMNKSLDRIRDIVSHLSIRDIESYADYLRRHARGAAAFGEITPAYALLPSAAFAEMDSLFPGARFIFIMRDPVDRLWSHVRFRVGKAGKRRHEPQDPNREFRKALQRRNSIIRSSYQRTIEELERAVHRDRILYLFYEELTSADTGPAHIRRIEWTLGLSHVETDQKLFLAPVNSSQSAELDPENEAAAVQLLAPVYAFVEQRFGHRKRWRSPGRSA